MKRKRYLYHVTDARNVPSIMLGGLKRGGGIKKAFAVYLSTAPTTWLHMAHFWFPNGFALLKVDISGLSSIEMTTFLPDSDEVLAWGDIPAWKQTKNGLMPRIKDVTDQFRDATKLITDENDHLREVTKMVKVVIGNDTSRIS